MASPVGCSVQHCCNKYGFTADDIACVATKSIDKYFLQNVGHGTVDIARMLLELIFIRDGSLYVNLPCFAHDVVFNFIFAHHVIFLNFLKKFSLYPVSTIS